MNKLIILISVLMISGCSSASRDPLYIKPLPYSEYANWPLDNRKEYKMFQRVIADDCSCGTITGIEKLENGDYMYLITWDENTDYKLHF